MSRKRKQTDNEADGPEIDYVKQSDAFVMALQIYERPPRSLQFREGVPTVYHPRTDRSGCSSSASWSTEAEAVG